MSTGDQKYGRLFTEADALALVAGAFEMGAIAGHANAAAPAETLMATLQPNHPIILKILADRGGLTFPADEPLFLLRGEPDPLRPILDLVDHANAELREAYGVAVAVGTEESAPASAAMARLRRAHDVIEALRDRVKVPE